MIIDINTILHTKDGRKIGNAIIIGRSGYYWIVKTDYGNELKLTEEEIRNAFYIAFKDEDNTEELQEYCQLDHKHKVNIQE